MASNGITIIVIIASMIDNGNVSICSIIVAMIAIDLINSAVACIVSRYST